jgi:hypothetical protein
MSRNEVSENLINHYLEPQKGKRPSLKSIYATKKSGKSLNEFYNEVEVHKNNHGLENVFFGKSANEIEQIMLNNRKLIEAHHSKR